MTEKYVKGEDLLHPNRYNENKIEAWDFTIQSLLPHTISTVVEYVIRYKHKGGLTGQRKLVSLMSTSNCVRQGYLADKNTLS